jgi:uncharacterized protein (DUF302 family)
MNAPLSAHQSSLNSTISKITVEHVHLSSAKPFEQARADLERQLGEFDPNVYREFAGGASAASISSRIGAMAGTSGLMLFAVQDHGSLLKIVEAGRKALQYVVGNPLIAIQMTQHAIGAGLYAPLRVLLYEDDSGATCLEYDRPSSQFGQFNDKRVNQVAASLDQKLAALAAIALG